MDNINKEVFINNKKNFNQLIMSKKIKLNKIKLKFFYIILIKKYEVNNSINNKLSNFYKFVLFFNNNAYLLSSNQNLIFNNSKLNTFNKLSIFNLNYLNTFMFFNYLTSNYSLFFKYLRLESISNYNLNYLFIYYYYFIKNVKLGISKYFTHYYQNNLYFLRFFIMKYLSTFLESKKLTVNLSKSNLKIFESKLKYKILLNKLKYLKYLKSTNFKIKSLLNLILVSLYSKDIILLKNMITLIIEKLHFKEHKKFLNSLKLIFKKIKYVFFKTFKCKGLFIRIKGKIGVGGNLKKRKMVIKFGSFSFTKKNQKLTYNKSVVRTESGVLGLDIYLTYK